MRSVLALDIGGTKLVAAVVTGDGCVRCRQVAPTRLEDGVDRMIERAMDLASAVVEEAGAGGTLTSLGVASKGLTGEDGVLISGIPGWSSLRIPARLRRRFPDLAVSIMNDVKAATLAEMTWGALVGVSHGVYVNLGTGIAAGIVARGEILEGAHGAAGEIGYLLPGRDAIGRARAVTGKEVSGKEEVAAPLEELVGGLGVPARTYRELGLELTMEQLTERSSDDDKAAAVLDDILSDLALWMVNLAIVVDPERMVIGGGFLRSHLDLCGRIRKLFDRAAVFSPDVQPAHFGADSALVGAGALALRS